MIFYSVNGANESECCYLHWRVEQMFGARLPQFTIGAHHTLQPKTSEKGGKTIINYQLLISWLSEPNRGRCCSSSHLLLVLKTSLA